MSTGKTSPIECSGCGMLVQANVIGEKIVEQYDYVDSTMYGFLECSICGNILLGRAEYGYGPDGDDFGIYKRLWPDGKIRISDDFPDEVSRSLKEAITCYEAKAYMACAVMCGRAIESICHDKTKLNHRASLENKLKSLLENKIIDEKIFRWGDALRIERNIGAHAGKGTVKKNTAKDTLDFSIAIAEYVYVLDEKYNQYMKRKAEESLDITQELVSS